MPGCEAICVYVCTQGYMDIASLSDVVSTTGGTLYQYTPFNPVMDHDQVQSGVYTRTHTHTHTHTHTEMLTHRLAMADDLGAGCRVSFTRRECR